MIRLNKSKVSCRLAARGAGSLEQLPDEQLLGRFIADREEAAFVVLVSRHATRVMWVCRQILGRSQEAEDVFQSTFLLLARKADSIQKRASLGHWLHGVAHRISVKTRARSSRRRSVEARGVRLSVVPEADSLEREDQTRILHEEIDRLPTLYRQPVLLCYMDGRTNEEAARLLGCPTGSLKARLGRAREILHDRLSRRGLALAPLLLLLLGAREASAEVPERLVSETVVAASKARRWRPVHSSKRAKDSGTRFAPVALASIVITSVIVTASLAMPTPARGSLLGWLFEAARRACH
jgi:RNA polymerase sigma factor (sigma-70 family)